MKRDIKYNLVMLCFFIALMFTTCKTAQAFDANESKAILEFLYHHSTQPQFLYRHRWTEKDLLIWDNRSMMHFAVMDYPDDEPRYMERCTVIGEPPA